MAFFFDWLLTVIAENLCHDGGTMRLRCISEYAHAVSRLWTS